MTAILQPTDIPDAHRLFASHPRPGVGDQTTEGAQSYAVSHRISGALGSNFPDDTHCHVDSQENDGVIGEPNLPQPNRPTSAKAPSAAATNLPHAQVHVASHTRHGVGDQAGTETAHRYTDSHNRRGGLGPILRDPTLALAADVVDDLEHVRDANANRLHTLTSQGEHGHGMSTDHPDIKRLAELVNYLEQATKQASKNLSRVMRYHPLGPWVKSNKGVGEKQAARLLCAIGDPYWNDLHNRPRTVRELYAFCGFAGPGQVKQRGERVTWSPNARKRAWLIAAKCVQVGHGGPYRAEYEAGRAKYADALHGEECKRCGPKGQPAQPGSPLSPGHQNARAIRLTAKKILKDLWTESKRLHESESVK